MTATAGFLGLLRDVLAPLGPITVRRMFGGAGIYCEGSMFALVADDTLYLKADERSKAMFVAEGMGPFTYDTAKGGNVVMSYWRIPDRLLEDSDEMVVWARTALAVASRKKVTSGGMGAKRRRKLSP
jgi:DNA transformation protein